MADFEVKAGIWRREVSRARGVSGADAKALMDRAYARMATELNCCGCYVGCVTIPVLFVSTGLLVVSVVA